MEYPTIESFTYRELQKLGRKSTNIKLNISKATLYNELHNRGYLPCNMDVILVYIPPEIIERILYFSEDEVYTIFTLTSKYWYDKSFLWWDKRYIQLGGYLPLENTIPPKLLYNQVRRRYANVLVKIEEDTVKTYNIPLSINITSDIMGRIVIETCTGMYLMLRKDDKIAKNSTMRSHILWMNEQRDSYARVLGGKLKKIYGNYALTNGGKLYDIDKNARVSNLIDIPSINNFEGFPDSIYCLTYDQKIYKLDKTNRRISKTLLTDIPTPITSIHKDYIRIYFISEYKIYYMNNQSQVIHSIDTSLPIEYIRGTGDIICYISGNKLCRYNPSTSESIISTLNLKYIVDVECTISDGLYLLGKR